MTKTNKTTVAAVLAVLMLFGFISAGLLFALKAEAVGDVTDNQTSTESATNAPETIPDVTDAPETNNVPETNEIPETNDVPETNEVPETSGDETNADTTAGIEVDGMRFVSEELTLRIGESVQLEIVVSPEGAELPTVTYSSSDTEIVSIDENGTATANKSGQAVITATIQISSGELKCSCEIIASSSSIRLETLTNTGMKIVSGFSVGMTVEDVITEIAMMKEIPSEQITVTKDGEQILNGDSIATGITVSVEGAEHIAILYGDVNGDGLINSDDTRAITEYITGADTLTTDAQLLAADVLHEGDITIKSALVIQRHIFEYETIIQ